MSQKSIILNDEDPDDYGGRAPSAQPTLPTTSPWLFGDIPVIFRTDSRVSAKSVEADGTAVLRRSSVPYDKGELLVNEDGSDDENLARLRELKPTSSFKEDQDYTFHTSALVDALTIAETATDPDDAVISAARSIEVTQSIGTRGPEARL